MGFLRVAGTGRSPEGDTVTWSVAEGRRGRRWRESVVQDGAVVHSLLFELDPDGRFAHLELTTTAGLLTLHPEGDGTIHGNAISGAGISHIRGLPWDRDAVVLIERSVVSRVVAGHWQRARALDELDMVWVAHDLTLTRQRTAIAKRPVDPKGLPMLELSHQWQLEEH